MLDCDIKKSCVDKIYICANGLQKTYLQKFIMEYKLY